MTLREYLSRRTRPVLIASALVTLAAVAFAMYASKESAWRFAVFCMLLSVVVVGTFRIAPDARSVAHDWGT